MRATDLQTGKLNLKRNTIKLFIKNFYFNLASSSIFDKNREGRKNNSQQNMFSPVYKSNDLTILY